MASAQKVRLLMRTSFFTAVFDFGAIVLRFYSWREWPLAVLCILGSDRQLHRYSSSSSSSAAATSEEADLQAGVAFDVF